MTFETAPARTAGPRGIMWAIFAWALVVRIAGIQLLVGFHTPAALEPASDSRIHMMLVQSLLAGHGFSLFGSPTGETPPLYVFFLTGLYAITHDPAVVRVVQAVLGAAGCVVVYAIGARLFDRVAAAAAAFILSVYPLAVYLTGLHLTENLFLFLLLVAVLLAVETARRPSAVAACGLGVLLGLASLTRAAFVGFLPLVVPWAMATWGVRGRPTSRIAALVLVCAAAVILPWTVRNYVVLHAVVPVQSNGGLMFWAGNNAYTDGGIVWPTWQTWTATRLPDTKLYGWHDLSVSQTNALYIREALSWIRTHPGRFLRLLPLKLARLYGFTKSQNGEDLHIPRLVVLAHAGVLALAAAGMWLTRRRWAELSFLILLIVFTNAMVLVFSGSTRYEVPMIPSLVLFSGAALSAIWTHAAEGRAPALAGPRGRGVIADTPDTSLS